MINAKLQDFATGATTRGQLSFGDVRRLQRDCLPQGITTRDEAERLIALDAALTRADKAWAAWLVPALADFVSAQQAADAADTTKAWLQALLAQSPAAAALGRKIARHIRRASQPAASDACDAQPRPRRKVQTCKAQRAAARIAPIVASEIVVRPGRRAAARAECRTTGAPCLPCEPWSPGLMEKHWRFQLARPAA